MHTSGYQMHTKSYQAHTNSRLLNPNAYLMHTKSKYPYTNRIIFKCLLTPLFRSNFCVVSLKCLQTSRSNFTFFDELRIFIYSYPLFSFFRFSTNFAYLFPPIPYFHFYWTPDKRFPESLF